MLRTTVILVLLLATASAFAPSIGPQRQAFAVNSNVDTDARLSSKSATTGPLFAVKKGKKGGKAVAKKEKEPSAFDVAKLLNPFTNPYVIFPYFLIWINVVAATK
jgi:hypothetical protein